jgi:hypothetical protein
MSDNDFSGYVERRYLGEHNRKHQPFLWTADPDRIIEKWYQLLASEH